MKQVYKEKTHLSIILLCLKFSFFKKTTKRSTEWNSANENRGKSIAR